MARFPAKWPSFIQICAASGLTACIAAVFYPIFRSPDPRPIRRVSCASNLKQLGLACRQYEEDSDGGFPSGRTAEGNGWAGQIYPFVKSAGVYHCPSDAPRGAFVSYAENQNIAGQNSSKFPALACTVALYEFTTLSCDPATAETVSTTGLSAPPDSTRHDDSRHPFGLNFGFADGHVKFLTPGQVSGGPGAQAAQTLPSGKIVGTFAVRP